MKSALLHARYFKVLHSHKLFALPDRSPQPLSCSRSTTALFDHITSLAVYPKPVLYKDAATKNLEEAKVVAYWNRKRPDSELQTPARIADSQSVIDTVSEAIAVSSRSKGHLFF